MYTFFHILLIKIKEFINEQKLCVCVCIVDIDVDLAHSECATELQYTECERERREAKA